MARIVIDVPEKHAHDLRRSVYEALRTNPLWGPVGLVVAIELDALKPPVFPITSEMLTAWTRYEPTTSPPRQRPEIRDAFMSGWLAREEQEAIDSGTGNWRDPAEPDPLIERARVVMTGIRQIADELDMASRDEWADRLHGHANDLAEALGEPAAPLTATERLIRLAESLTPSGEIGDGMVAQFRDLAQRAKAERTAPPIPPRAVFSPEMRRQMAVMLRGAVAAGVEAAERACRDGR